MKSKIDFRSVLSDPLHVVRIIFYVILVAVLLVPLQSVVLHRTGWGDSIAQVFSLLPPGQPAFLAGGIEVQEGVLGFNGHSTRGIWTGQVTTALAAVIASYLIGPTLLVWGIRARAHYRKNVPVWGGATSIALALTLGGFSLLTVLPAPMYAIVSGKTHAIMARDCRSSELADVTSIDLYMMARRAQVRYFLSGDAREKTHSWLTRDGSGKPAIDMPALLSPGELAGKGDSVYVSGDGRRFTLRIESADSLTICAIRDWEDLRADEGATEGTQKKLKMCAGVSPDHVRMVLVD